MNARKEENWIKVPSLLRVQLLCWVLSADDHVTVACWCQLYHILIGSIIVIVVVDDVVVVSV